VASFSSSEEAPPVEPLKEGAVRDPQSGPSDRTQNPHLVEATRAASRRRGKHDRHHDHRGDSEGDHKGLPPAPAASPFGRLHVPLRSARVAAIDSVAAPGSCNAAGAAELPIEFVIYITEPRGGPGRTRDRVRIAIGPIPVPTLRTSPTSIPMGLCEQISAQAREGCRSSDCTSARKDEMKEMSRLLG
jgi:hypothetical protein